MGSTTSKVRSNDIVFIALGNKSFHFQSNCNTIHSKRVESIDRSDIGDRPLCIICGNVMIIGYVIVKAI